MKKFVQALIIMCCVVELYADITAENLLNKHKEFQKSISEKRIESTIIAESKDSTVNESTFRAKYESFITDSSRTRFKTMAWVEIASPEEIGSLKKLDESPTAEKTVIWDNKTYFEHRPRKLLDTEFAFASKDIDRNQRHLAVGYTGGPLEGICRGDMKSIVDLFDNGTEIEVEKDIMPVNGRDVECYSLSMENEDGKWKVWLSPEYDYNIYRMETQKKEGQPAYGGKLPLKGPTGGDMTELSFVLSDVKFEKMDGKWIAKQGRYIVERKYSDGRMQTDIIEHKRTHVDLSPDFDKAFVPEIKEGTRVLLDGPDDDVIPYIWKDGQIVPGVNHAIEKIIDSEIELYVDNDSKVLEEIEPVVNETETQQEEITQKVSDAPEALGTIDVPDVSNRKYIFVFLFSVIFVALTICGAGFYLVRRKGNQETRNS